MVNSDNTPHQVEISCLRCATRFITSTDHDGRAVRLLCSGCSAPTGQTVHMLRGSDSIQPKRP